MCSPEHGDLLAVYLHLCHFLLSLFHKISGWCGAGICFYPSLSLVLFYIRLLQAKIKVLCDISHTRTRQEYEIF